MEKNLNPLYVILEAQNALSKAAGKNLSKLIAKGRQSNRAFKNMASSINKATKKIDPLTHLSNARRNMSNSKTWVDKVASDVGGGVATAISSAAKGTGKAAEMGLHMARMYPNMTRSALGAKYLTQGQNAVGKARKTLGGKVKQYGQNFDTVFDKINN